MTFRLVFSSSFEISTAIKSMLFRFKSISFRTLKFGLLFMNMDTPPPLLLSLILYTWEYHVKLCKDILYSVSHVSVNDNTEKKVNVKDLC